MSSFDFFDDEIFDKEIEEKRIYIPVGSRTKEFSFSEVIKFYKRLGIETCDKKEENKTIEFLTLDSSDDDFDLKICENSSIIEIKSSDEKRKLSESKNIDDFEQPKFNFGHLDVDWTQFK